MEEKEYKIQCRFSTYELDRVIITLLNNLSNLTFVKNLNELVSRLDKDSYTGDEEKATRIFIISKITSKVLGENILDKQILLNTLDFNGKYEEQCNEVLNIVCADTVNDKEAENIDKKISGMLKFGVFEHDADALIKRINTIKSESYDDLNVEILKAEQDFSVITTKLKKYNDSIAKANNKVSLSGQDFISRLNKVVEREKNPSSTIKTGIKTLNQILGGGFKAGRVYCCMAPMKNWKSGLLLNAAIWAKKYNTLKPKDPTKKPVILYITLENSIDETIERCLSYCEGNSFDITQHTVQDDLKILELNGIFNPNDSNKDEVGIEFAYYPNKSVTVQDIGQIIDEYNKEGKEVAFVCVDYIKRIRPSMITKDLRLDLGGIADDLHVLAIDKDIPILTAMQLNRSAISEIDQAESFEQKQAAFNRIGTSNVGESIDIPQNVDLCFTMLKTVDAHLDENGATESIDKYLNFRVVASRYNVGDVDSFIHRFVQGNDMALIEDINSKISASTINSAALIKNRIVKTKGARHA